MSIQIKLKNSVVQDSTPSTSDLPAVGEIALNANINSIGGFMRASNNTIVKIFGPGSLSTPTATTTVSGISELATNSETTAGSATNRVVTPAGLNAVTVAERTTSNTNYVAKAGSTLTGVLTMPNGSNSAPAINFGDSDSGIFGGTNTVSLTAGGTTRLTADTGVSVTGTLAVTGAITSTSDLTIADKIIHAGDTNTAVRFPAADTVSVETGGSEALRVDSSQRLLVGTSTARSTAGRIAAVQIENNSNKHVSIVRNSNDNGGAVLALGKTRAGSIIQNNDSVGIIAFVGDDGNDLDRSAAQIIGEIDGTPGADDMPGRLVFSTTADGAASPTTRLTIDSAGTSTFAGNIATTGTLTLTSNSPRIILTESDADPDYEVMASTGEFKIKADGTGKIIIRNDGHIDLQDHVDISSGLDVTGAITGTGDVTITKASPVLRLADTTDPQGTDGIIGKLEFFGNDGSSGGADVRSFIQTISTNSTGNSHALTIGLGESNNAPTEKIRILGDGKVGIGTSNPLNKLHVEGSVGSGGFITKLFNTLGSGDVNGHVLFLDANRSDTTNTRLIDSKDNKFTVFSNGAANFSSNVVVDGGTVRCNFGFSSDTDLILNADANNNASNSIIFKESGTETARFKGDGDLLLTRQTAGGSNETLLISANYGSGSDQALQASNSLRFYTNGANERLRIKSTGEIGINTSSPRCLLDLGLGTDAATISNTAADYQLGLHAAQSATGDIGRNIAFISQTQGTVCAAITSADVGASDQTALVFATGNSSSIAERVRIDQNGKVNIGGTQMSSNLLNIEDQTAGAIDIASHGVGGDTAYIGVKKSAGGGLTFGISNRDFIFKTGAAYSNGTTFDSGTERLRIDSNGRVGIGTSSMGSHQLVSEGGKAETGGSCLALKTSGGASGVTSDLALYGTFVTPTNDQATRRTADIVSGFSTGNWGNEFLAFHVGKAGSSNDTQAVTDEQMRIDTNGRLMVGVTSANDTATALTIKNGFSGNEHTILEIICDDNETSRVTFSEASNMNNGSIRYSFTNDVRAMTFHTNGQSERMRITNNGNVHIARTSAMDLGANNVTGIDLLHSGRVVAARNGAAALHIGRQGDTGEVALFANQGTAIVGSISVTTSATSYNTSASDRTLKKNFENWTENTLNLFKNINPQKFNFTDEEDTDPKHKGYVAQDLIDSFPEAYNKNDNDKYMFNPSGMVVYLMKAIQELEAKVAALEAA